MSDGSEAANAAIKASIEVGKIALDVAKKVATEVIGTTEIPNVVAKNKGQGQ